VLRPSDCPSTQVIHVSKNAKKTSDEPMVKDNRNSMKFQIFFQLEEGAPFRAIRTAPQHMATTSFLMKNSVLLNGLARQDKNALVPQRNSRAERHFVKRS